MPRSHFRAALTYVFGSASKREKRMKGALYIREKKIGCSTSTGGQVKHPIQKDKKVECDCLSENLVEESTSRSK